MKTNYLVLAYTCVHTTFKDNIEKKLYVVYFVIDQKKTN